MKPEIPVTDYSKRRRKALKWLGDKYLCAQPVPRREPTQLGMRGRDHENMQSVQAVLTDERIRCAPQRPTSRSTVVQRMQPELRTA